MPVCYHDEALKEAVKSGWRDRQKISILVELTVCQKNVAKIQNQQLNSVGITLKNKV